jgi:uncharacterized SAM-binding protein YcdF (DUF218 family)
MHQHIKKADAIFCLCSHDKRVAYRAAELYLDELAEYVIFSGGVGRLTRNLLDTTEADEFARIAVNCGVPINKIIVENKSANTGENIRFTHDLLKEKGIEISSFILVQKPYMERRTFATFKKQWPDKEVRLSVTSPQLSYEDYMADGIAKNDAINVMVGDMQRIKEYPKLGFQIEQEIPDDVWQAFTELVESGFDKHLLVS